MADFILVPCCQNDEVAGMNLKIVSFAVIFAPMLADIGILLVALVIRQPCIRRYESIRRAQNRFAYAVTSYTGNKAKTRQQVLLLSTACVMVGQMCSLMFVVRQSG